MDEQNKPAEQPVEAPAEATPDAPVEQPERPAWAVALDGVSAEDLRKHDKISGIVGSEKQGWEKSWEASRAAQMAEEARKKAEADREAAEAELDKLYDENPLTFADKLQNQRNVQRTQERIKKLESNARQSVAHRIGAAFHDIPEWEQVVNDPAEYATLMQAIQGKSDDEVIPAWNRAATDAVSRVRAKNLAESSISERLVKEKAAWEEEAAARGLVTSTRPDIRRGSRTATLDPEPDWRSPQYQAWYERNTPGAKRSRR